MPPSMAHLTRGLTTEPPVRRAQRKRYASLRHERRLPRDLSPKSSTWNDVERRHEHDPLGTVPADGRGRQPSRGGSGSVAPRQGKVARTLRKIGVALKGVFALRAYQPSGRRVYPPAALP